ncbi:MAG: ATP synthase F0 subunit A [Candidatus Chisholmbacteria bacterium RIFCSPLOWO2_01_FULL_49_14]|jgi:F-type H+-transporting ATPase subunit a|uniref:ATP synthase subunit a n=1 Tax=Candidatus Chisholmbacteria bacterium RIFCSPLOWO2_01_FULL_49_14 TaxID=1797593 RepID=A0A1G1W1L2_9BACT|nr:MAG: ATP synthase F0 subunit A [Candidatus Chisholmbacteria bacterium RIFCSPLOWO2_01_FULL_49_14]
MAKIHVSISAEPIFHLGNVEVTNSMLTGVAVSVLLVSFAYWLHKKLSDKKKISSVQNVAEMAIEGFYSLMVSVAGEEKTKRFYPVIATLFFYILFSNWLELLPGVGTIGLNVMHNGVESFAPLVRPPSADLNSTLGLALFSVIGSQVVGLKYLNLSYLKRFFDFSGPGKFILGLLEFTSELSRIISFAFRLFGNIFAGEVLLAVSLTLLPLLAPIPFLGLEIFVGAIQALVFAILTLVFWQMASTPHGEENA